MPRHVPGQTGEPLRRDRVRGRPRGFSLAEVVIAILILSTLSVVLVGVIPASMFGMKTAENRAKAACLARSAVEALRTYGLDRVTSGDLASTTSNGTEYSLRVIADRAPKPLGGWMDLSEGKSVQVIVTWKERNIEERYSADVILMRQ